MAAARLMSGLTLLSRGRSFFTCAAFHSPIQIQMPALSPTMVEGTITKWLIAEGDSVEIGDAMCEVETDKAVVTMEAIEDGKLAKILVPEGTSNIKISVPIAILAEEGEDIAEAAKMTIDSPTSAKPPQEQASTDAATSHQPGPPVSAVADQPKGGKYVTNLDTRLSPAVRQTIQHYGVDINQITATGPKGLILKGDVLEYIEKNKIQVKNFDTQEPTSTAHISEAAAKTTVSPRDAAQTGNFTDVELTNVRKIIAKRLTESKREIPHAYSSIQCTISKLMKLRKELAKEGFKLSLNDFIIKAAAHTLRQVPEANCVWVGGAAEQATTVDVSVAVATDGGLITPIIKNATGKGLSEIAGEIRELAGRAREGKLKPDEFQGGTFTISNLGMFGIREFTAVINPPQTCIMAVGGTRLTPSSLPVDLDSDDDVTDAQYDVESVMTVTLSSDARVVDDVIASKFLEKFRRNVENPLMLGLL